MIDFSKAVDDRCGTINNNTALTIFSSSSTALLTVFTIPLNFLLVFVLIKERHQKRYQSLWYKLLLNIAISDLLTGLVADPNAFNVLLKEALRAPVSTAEVYVMHLSLFLTDAVALCTLTVLSLDRVVAILYPVKHYKGVGAIYSRLLVVSTWVLGVCLVLPYFKLKFIRQLFIFSIINISATVFSLIVTTVTYRHKLKPQNSKNDDRKISTTSWKISSNSRKISTNSTSKNTDGMTSSTSTEMRYASESSSINERQMRDKGERKARFTETEIKTDRTRAGVTQSSSSYNVTPASPKTVRISDKPMVFSNNSTAKSPKTGRKISRISNNNTSFISRQQSRAQRRATRTLLIMLVVFMATYLPTAITMILMNVCDTCDCLLIHVMRDLSIISILSSSLFRPLNFMLTLKHLQVSVQRLLGLRKGKRGASDSIISTTNMSRT